MEGIWRGLGLGRRAGIAGRHCEQAGKQALRADMGRHSYCVLHTCVRSVAPMELG